MKKLLLLLFIGIVGIGNAQNVNIPDANFKAYLVGKAYINTNGDAEIQVSEATAYNGSIYCQGLNISDLTGIEAFTTLTALECSSNQLTSLDVTQNTALGYLWCEGNQLTSLDVTQNTALIELQCAGNQLTSLDVTQNTALGYLLCFGNQLTSLDVTQNTALGRLHCNDNLLISLDVTQNTDLYILQCFYNQLTNLDVTQNTALGYLLCFGNQLTSLDVTQNTTLTALECSSNQLTSLDLTQNTALIYLYCQNNQLTSLDLTQNTALIYLYCQNNQLTSLDLTQNTALTWLGFSENQLTCLNVKNGNNSNMDDSTFIANNNPNLTCIEVDDVAWSAANWTNIDAQTTFSTACNNPCVLGVANADMPSLSIYPNPSITGLIQLNTSIVNSDINVYSIEGKQINFTQSNNVIDISDNEKGVYLISIDGVVIRYVYQE